MSLPAVAIHSALTHEPFERQCGEHSCGLQGEALRALSLGLLAHAGLVYGPALLAAVRELGVEPNGWLVSLVGDDAAAAVATAGVGAAGVASAGVLAGAVGVHAVLRGMRFDLQGLGAFVCLMAVLCSIAVWLVTLALISLYQQEHFEPAARKRPCVAVPRREPEAGDVCAICLDVLAGAGPPRALEFCELGCGKPCHRDCVREWLAHRWRCPNCTAAWPADRGWSERASTSWRRAVARALPLAAPPLPAGAEGG